MCTHPNPMYLNLSGKGFWYCDDCNHVIPKYIVKFSDKFKKFMNKTNCICVELGCANCKGDVYVHSMQCPEFNK